MFPMTLQRKGAENIGHQHSESLKKVGVSRHDVNSGLI